METAIAHNDWIEWQMRCQDCGYRFSAITPMQDYETCKRCTFRGSDKVEKKIGGGEVIAPAGQARRIETAILRNIPEAQAPLPSPALSGGIPQI